MSSSMSVVPFFFQGSEIRTVNDQDGKLWFVAKDVCDVLELDNVTNAILRIPESHLTLIRLRSGGQMREMNAVDEPGLYRLVLRSDKPQAEPFMEWVTEEVLPTIRKTGSYSLAGVNSSALDNMTTQLIEMIVPTVIEKATTAIMDQVSPMMNNIGEKVDQVQYNFAGYGTVWSFVRYCCQPGNQREIVTKDELYSAYETYCKAIRCKPECKSHFCCKIYRNVNGTWATTLSVGGRRVPAISGISLLSGYEVIIEDHRQMREETDRRELEQRREYYFGIKPGEGK